MLIKISVIIPVYNAEDYLAECLNSVIRQTIKEKEIICIDDGSRDKSYQILERYQRQYPYIRVFRQENKGPGEARNVGLKEALGKYVCFLDADDFYLDADALKKMVSACEENNVQACAGLRKLYKNGALEDFFWGRNYFEKGSNQKGIILDYKSRPDDYFYTNYIFSLDVIKEHQILFPPYRRYEDPPFFLRAMLLIERYMIVPVEFYGYRFPEEALERKETHIEDVLKGIRDNIKLARKNHLYAFEKLLADRISLEYVPGIVRNANKEILRLLEEVRTLLAGGKKKEQTAEAQTVLLDHIIILVRLKLQGYSIGDYLEEKGIGTVAVYGLGRYGKFFIEEVQNPRGIVLYGIDQKIRQMDGIQIGALEEINGVCDHIIVTPAKDNEMIAANIKKTWKGTVWGWNALIQEMEEYKVMNTK